VRLQSGDREDRHRDPGPAHLPPGRVCQGRHPRPVVPRSCEGLMPARSKARKRALDALYAADLRGEDPVEALDAATAAGEGPTNPYTGTLVRGVTEHRTRIDELIGQYAQGWTLDRMPAVDRNALRI